MKQKQYLYKMLLYLVLFLYAIFSNFDNKPKIKIITPHSQIIEYSIDIAKIKVNAHDRGYKGNGIIVAIIDSGINYNHEDLPSVYKGCRIINGKVYSVDIPKDYRDKKGHGTQVAGVITMQNNSKGYLGVAPNVKLMVIKATNNEYNGTMSRVNQAAAIEWAVNNGADVINVSYEQKASSIIVKNACKYAHDNNVSVIFTASNFGVYKDSKFPIEELTAINRVSRAKLYPGVLVIAEIIKDKKDQSKMVKSPCSSFGSGIDFCAPSHVPLPVYNNNSGYKISKGTSFSAPFVAGMIAIIRQRFPGISVDNIYSFLQDNCIKVGNGERRYYGRGMPVMPDLSLSYPRYEIDKSYTRIPLRRSDKNKHLKMITGYEM